MPMDRWLQDLVDRLNRARTRDEVMRIIDQLEDGYDAFSGPGEEWVAQLLEKARQRLDELA